MMLSLVTKNDVEIQRSVKRKGIAVVETLQRSLKNGSKFLFIGICTSSKRLQKTCL